MLKVFAIRIVKNEDFLEIKNNLLSTLPEKIQIAINRYKNLSSMQRTLLGEVLTRKILSKKLKIPTDQISIKKLDKGKPYVDLSDTDRVTQSHPVSAEHFNISHSADWVVVAFANSEVGVDIEKIRPINYRIAERFYSKQEYSELNKKQGKEKLDFFFDLWTLKESYVKLLGKGLTKSLSSFSIIKSNSNFKLFEGKDEIRTVFFKQYFIDKDYKLSACTVSDDFDENLEILKLSDLIKMF